MAVASETKTRSYSIPTPIVFCEVSTNVKMKAKAPLGNNLFLTELILLSNSFNICKHPLAHSKPRHHLIQPLPNESGRIGFLDSKRSVRSRAKGEENRDARPVYTTAKNEFPPTTVFTHLKTTTNLAEISNTNTHYISCNLNLSIIYVFSEATASLFAMQVLPFNASPPIPNAMKCKCKCNHAL